jgi:spore germination protein YaaH
VDATGARRFPVRLRAVHALFAALLALGPHAAEALAHARDAPAAWISMPVSPMRGTAAALWPKRVYGYLPYWESIDLTAFRWDLVSDVVVFSAEIGVDGRVTNPHGLPGAALLSAAHAHGARVHLCATLFNTAGGTEIATFLASPAARGNAVQQLIALAPDGVNVDFEFVPGASRDAFTAFVEQLRTSLPQTLELTLAMPATTAYSGYDVPMLAAAANRLLLMEYDYHWRTGPTAGAIAPLASVQSAVDSYLARVPPESIAMGVPYYGYEWPTSSASAGAATMGGGTSVLFESAFAKFASYGRIWDGTSQTPWYVFASSGQTRQGWMEDAESLGLKYRFARSRELAGVMIWALGYEGARTEGWIALQSSFLSGSADEPAPVVSARGCSLAGPAPGWILLAALLGLRPRYARSPRS